MHSSAMTLLCAFLIATRHLGLSDITEGQEFACWVCVAVEWIFGKLAVNVYHKGNS